MHNKGKAAEIMWLVSFYGKRHHTNPNAQAYVLGYSCYHAIRSAIDRHEWAENRPTFEDFTVEVAPWQEAEQFVIL